ncbi:putative CoA-substrate-specific enzyme activase [Hydrogenispora ethanolica]|jgi:predicted CoA-substrate-specific enzyme activase|uniref:Putative CoA-substrate-specific enzyme activase n=1 Tax=Hydrogenispora ethanolica TaxID=1082276 RepID=A0A4V2QGM9_HYDET|nr:acyl-CoA dehydratase activase [Hydrogenispora ethanolica]TCL76447.1 putative CoA-substrate-specific enzyme activase [Hydrogenispora ethanolica]
MVGAFLGVDVGSVSTNIVAVSPEGAVLSRQYIRTNGQPLECVKGGLKELQKALPELDVLGVGATGSGRQLAGILMGADIVKNEITAHAVATTHFYPDVRTIFEIGGQDSKIIFIKNGMVVDFAMNTVCAAGTGSFLDHQAERLKIPIEHFGELALSSRAEVRIAGRCTVFAESDMIAKQQYGFSKADIIKGLCEALVRNYINNLGRAKALEPPFVFQGGVAANRGIVAAFEKEVGCPVIVPDHFDVMGAIGAALLAKDSIESSGGRTGFRGFETADMDLAPRTFQCSDCSNSCEVIEVLAAGNPIARWGDKCGKWTNAILGSVGSGGPAIKHTA